MSLKQNQICECFNRVFGARYGVRLQGGGGEPDYVPGDARTLAVIVAREDFAASALHEAAHWCVASRRRRALPDYGYSYSPPPRSPARQAAFFAAEERVQAVEWYLARQAGLAFRASADDPTLPVHELEGFQAKLWPLVKAWEREHLSPEPPRLSKLPPRLSTLPPRALTFGRALGRLAAAESFAV